jgi:anhydro-N-acetylmuramic acid kinase
MPPSGLALGLMSGTSADGVSCALVSLKGRLEVLSEATTPYPAGLRNRILEAPGAGAGALCRLNFELGRFFASAALGFLESSGAEPRSLEAAGSHGQTVLHFPGGGGGSTLQIGEASFLAEALGVPVVCDFRPRDMAAGGQGAPLVPFFDRFVFGRGPRRALQNVGGIGNVSLAGRGTRPLGFDTGPGNCLMDLAVRRMSRGRLAFDRGGLIARRGRADEALAARLLRAPYFRRRPPKSLDKGEFGEAFFDKHLASLRPEDAVATAAYFTALSIADAYRRFLGPLSEAVVSGGGALNPVLMGHLGRLLAPLPVRTSADFGIPVLAKEPAMIALMALKAVRGEANHLPEATGARGPRILGKIIPSGRPHA